MEENVKQHLALTCGLVIKQQHQITSLKGALQSLTTSYNGTLLWKITDYSLKMAEAKSKEGYELCSAPFYTSQYGYKMMATLFLNGNGAGEGTYLSIYIKLLPGDFDALLQWPFSHTVSFTLLDQTSSPDKPCNVPQSFVPDPSWKNFQRPSRDPDSLGFGFPKFVSHETLKKRNYVKDDTIFIQVKVDPSKIIAVWVLVSSQASSARRASDTRMEWWTPLGGFHEVIILWNLAASMSLSPQQWESVLWWC